MARLTLLLALLAAPASAEPLRCMGAPNWTFDLNGDAGRLVFGGVTAELSVADETPSVSRPDLRALTLIGRDASAIVILTPRTCAGGDVEALILTQRGQSPLVLQGCCTSQPQ